MLSPKSSSVKGEERLLDGILNAPGLEWHLIQDSESCPARLMMDECSARSGKEQRGCQLWCTLQVQY
ncbi:hypothetical protein AOLI_G00170530 [Acnodon oligacanthus]